MQFYLGTDMPSWLCQYDVPMMVSRRRLNRYKTLPQAQTDWVLDSGGFTELSHHGKWTIPAHRYIAEVRRYYDNIGNMKWAAQQDWMCEPWVIAKTGKTILEHQQITVGNYIDLKSYSPELPIIPVLQGQAIGDYMRHVEMFADAGINLINEPTVGLGSVCRRQATSEIGEIVTRLHSLGLRLHGFGCKAGAVKRYGQYLQSADSMAWSFGGRFIKPCPVRGVASCAHCYHWAMEWRNKVLSASNDSQQYSFDFTY